jgi:lysophospholipase L1-like esterase
MNRTVICMGDSITRGLVSTNYVTLLERRFTQDGLTFVNAGVNADHTYNLLRRLDPLIALQPQFVTVLIGTNDVTGSLSTARGVINRIAKSLPRMPDLEWSYANLVEIIQRLKEETSAHIAVASIPVVGEDLDSIPNRRVKAYSACVRNIAAQQSVVYLPVYEEFVKYLEACCRENNQPYRWSYVYTASEMLVRKFLLGQNYDTISAQKGFKLVTDGVHLNSQGASLIADEIELFLRSVI